MNRLRTWLSAYGRHQWAALNHSDVAIWSLTLYCLIHFSIRLMLAHNFSLDEAEQVLFGESLEWGYRFRHPPLMTWLSYGVFAVSHTGREAYFAMKYILMGLGLFAYFATARLVLADVRLSLLATFGLLTTFVMGFLPHQDLMHTVLLATMLAAFWWMGLRAIHTRALADYLWLGAAAGLGILSKYIFAVGVAGFLVAMLWEREARRRLRLDGLWLSAAVAMLVVAPYLWWVATNEYSFFTLAKGITGGKGLALDPIVWSKGFLNLVLALVEFAIPFVLIFAALFPQSFRRVAPVMPESDRMNLRLLEVAMLAAVTMMLAAVFFVGTEAFKPRWMHQVLMPLPIYLFLRAKYAPISVRRYQYFALICAGFALAVVASRFIIWETNVDGCKRCREYRPYDRFAAGLRGAGFVAGTIVAEDYDLGGNIRAAFLSSRVVTPGYPLAVFGPPETARGQCLFLWFGDKPMPKAMAQYADEALSAAADSAARRGRVTAHYLKSESRLVVLQYELLPDGAGACH